MRKILKKVILVCKMNKNLLNKNKLTRMQKYLNFKERKKIYLIKRSTINDYFKLIC